MKFTAARRVQLAILLNLILCFFNLPLHAQSSGTKVYISGGFGGTSTGNLHGLSGTYVHPSNWGVSVAYKVNNYKCSNLPGDYQSGLCVWGDCTPDDQLTIFSIHAVHIFPLQTTKLVRFIVEAGPSIINHTEATFTPIIPTGWFSGLGGNYDQHYTTRSAAGLSLRATVSFPFSRGFGVEASGTANINRYHSMLGVEFSACTGILRDRRKPKKHRK